MAFGENRQRLRPWLECKINSGSIPGLEWIDEERTTFRLPWKHAGKQNWSENDCLLFKEWAIHTGRYREGVDSPDWATWKTRLRCAFNKASDIQELRDLSRVDDQDAPYRVYKLLPKIEKQSRCQPDMNSHYSPMPSSPEDFKAEAKHPSCCQAVGPQVPTTVPQKFMDYGVTTSTSLPSDLKGIESEDLLSQQSDQAANLQMLYTRGGQWPTSAYEQPGSVSPPADESYYDESYYYDMDNGETIAKPMDEQPAGATMVTAFMNCIGSEEAISFDDDFINRLSKISQAQYTTSHKLGVKIAYKEDVVYELLVDNEHGCRLHYGFPLQTNISQSVHVSKLYGPTHLQQIALPDCTGLCQTEELQIKTFELLGYVDRGLVLEIDPNGSIYATRLCRCVVFVAMPFAEGNPVKLERHTRTKVFDFETEFCHAYDKYASGKGPKPSIEVHFGFGQTWSCTQPFKNLMVKAVIVNTRALELLTQVHNSLTSIGANSVCISNKDEYDDLADRMKQQTLHEFMPQASCGPELMVM